MGDNIWLGDRDGVRTPMQWTPDRNAGFSTCDPGRLICPPVQDPVYGYQVTNVEAAAEELDLAAALDAADDRGAQAEPGLRARAPSPTSAGATRRCSLSSAGGKDRRAWTSVLCVNNLSRSPSRSSSTCRAYEGVQPVELLGGAHFPRIGELPYLLTLAGHGFYWFRLDQAARREPARRPAQQLRGAPAVARRPRRVPVRPALVLRAWHRGRGRRGAPAGPAGGRPGGRAAPGRPPARSTVPRPATSSPSSAPPSTVPRLEHVADRCAAGATTPCTTADVTGVWLPARWTEEATPRLGPVPPGRPADRAPDRPSLVLTGEQSNTSFVYGDAMALKVFRQVAPGVNPDVEVHAALDSRREPAHRAPRSGWVGQRRRRRSRSLQEFLTGGTEGWEPAQASVRDLFAEADLHAARSAATSPARPSGSGRVTARCTPPCGRRCPHPCWTAEQVAARVAGDARRPGRRGGRGARAGAVRGRAAARVRRPADAGPLGPGSTSSGCTATSTSARPCGRPAAGRSSTSRASRPARPTSAGPSTPRCATSPACCGRFDYAARLVLLDHPGRHRSAPTARPSGSSATATPSAPATPRRPGATRATTTCCCVRC